MFLPAITWQSFFYRCINQLLFMWFDDAGYVLGTTVAHLHRVLIKYFVRLVGGWEGWRNSWRNLFPTFVETALLKGGLNQIMLRYRFLFVWLLLVLLNFSLISSGNWLIIWGGWFEDLLKYYNKLFAFLYVVYGPLFYMFHCLIWTWCLKRLQF